MCLCHAEQFLRACKLRSACRFSSPPLYIFYMLSWLAAAAAVVVVVVTMVVEEEEEEKEEADHCLRAQIMRFTTTNCAE